MNSGNQRFYRTNSLVALNETGSVSSLLYSIAEILEITSEYVVVQMFTSDDMLHGEELSREKPFKDVKINFSILFHHIAGVKIVFTVLNKEKNYCSKDNLIKKFY